MLRRSHRNANNAAQVSALSLKKGMLLFWTGWTGIVTVMNVLDEMKALGILPGSWPASSGNYKALVKTTSVYELPRWLDKLLLLIVIGWEGTSALLFWRTVLAYRRRDARRLSEAYRAYTCLLALFGAFIVGDEIFHQYDFESDHRGIAMLLLACLFATQFLPEAEGER